MGFYSQIWFPDAGLGFLGVATLLSVPFSDHKLTPTSMKSCMNIHGRYSNGSSSRNGVASLFPSSLLSTNHDTRKKHRKSLLYNINEYK